MKNSSTWPCNLAVASLFVMIGAKCSKFPDLHTSLHNDGAMIDALTIELTFGSIFHL